MTKEELQELTEVIARSKSNTKRLKQLKLTFCLLYFIIIKKKGLSIKIT